MQKPLLRLAAALAFVAGSAVTLATGPAAAQNLGVVTATHGAWTIRCATEGSDECIMIQTGQVEGQDALVVALRRVNGVQVEGQPVPAVLDVTAPLGVLLTYQVRLQIDGGETRVIVLQRCSPQNCAGRTPVSEQMVADFKRGNIAKFGFYLDREVLVDLSLSGFTKAYNSLKPITIRQQ